MGWRVGQSVGSPGVAPLSHRLLSLPMAGAVLHLGAHPDDEDSGLLAYLAHGRHVRAAYWSATRGESGQNGLNSYRGEALGVFRSWESEDARAIDGAESLFGPFRDFGYSKSGAETLAKWGREAVVREIVRAIRLVQPEIVISRWSGQPVDEHGHHQAIGEVAEEAFRASGDEDRFPELRRIGLEPWQPRRLFGSVGGDWTPEQALTSLGRRRPDLERDDVIAIDAGALDPLEGRTFQEQGWSALAQHRSQRMALLPEAGAFLYYYRLVAESGPERAGPIESLFDGLDPRLTGLAVRAGEASAWLRSRLEQVQSLVERALTGYVPAEPSATAPYLLEASSALREAISQLGARLQGPPGRALTSYLERKLRDFEQASAACLGLRLECRTEAIHVTPGDSLELEARLWGLESLREAVGEIRAMVPDDYPSPSGGGRPASGEKDGVIGSARFEVKVPEAAQLSWPYWLAEPSHAHAYHWPPELYCALPFRPPRFEAECELELGDHALTIRSPAIARTAFPGGWRDLYPSVIPPVSLHCRPSVTSLPGRAHEPTPAERLPDPYEPGPVAGSSPLVVELQVQNRLGVALSGSLEADPPSGMAIEPASIEVRLGANESKSFAFTLAAAAHGHARHVIDFRMDVGGRNYRTGMTPVRMGPGGGAGEPDAASCVRETFVPTPARTELHVIAARFARSLRHAYVRGPDESVPALLEPFGVEIEVLSDRDLQWADFARFDTVVIGPGAYSTHPELRPAAERLMDYVAAGGTLIVQHQPYSYQRADLAPYPFRYSEPHDRVTDETAPVRRLAPDDSLLQSPNEISDRDFEGWVDERGRYFFGSWDPRYRPLLGCADPGEEPRLGGLLVADHGRGTYVYCGYSLHRQLHAGVEGAFRLFANLLAIPAVRLAERMAFMRGTELFASLPDEQLAALAGATSERVIENGAVISSQGDPAREVYVIREGEVAIMQHRNGTEHQLRVCREGDPIGELSALGKVTRTASIVARRPTRLIVLEEDQVEQLLETHPEVSRALLALLARRMANELRVRE